MPTKKAPAKKVTKKSAPKKKAAVTKTVKKSVKKPVAKKVVKKTPVKKTTKARKTTAMKKPVKDLVYASDQESFWVQNGEVLNSLMALRDALTAMEKSVYEFHAEGDQNDFSIWVDTVLCDGDCAAALSKAKTPRSAKTAVVKHLKLYSI